MHIEYLREFVTLADVKSFTKAAKHCNISQSTMSKHVKALEDEYRIDLVSRTDSGIRLTRAGWSLAHDARDIMNRYDTAVQHLDEIRSDEGSQIKLGYFSPSSTWLILRLHRWAKRNKRMQYRITPVAMMPAQLEEALQNRTVDAVVMPESNNEISSFCNSLELRKEHMLVAVAKNSPLAKYDEVKLVDLVDERFFMPDKTIWPMIGRHLDELLGDIPNYREGWQLEDTETLMGGIMQDMGIAIVLDHNRSIYGNRVRFVELKEERESGFEISLSLMWLKDAETSYATQNKISFLKRVFTKIAADPT